MPTQPWQGEDAILAASIFGTVDRDAVDVMITAWVEQQTGQRCDGIVALEMSVGAAVTVRLADGGLRFVKVWPGTVDAAGLCAQLRVQGTLAAGGFPAPAVLAGPLPLGPAVAALMVFDQSGVATDVRIAGVRDAMARALARLVEAAQPLLGLPDLPRWPLPADDWPWPKPHNALFDFKRTSAGAEWIDDLARNALARLRTARSAMVVGHRDWSAKNMRMGAREIAVVYDWDAIYVDRETFMLASAAAHFPVTWELPVPETPTSAESAAFLHAYAAARGRPVTDDELAEVAAAMTYAHAYKARCEHAGDPQRRRWQGSSRQALQDLGAYEVADLTASN